MVADFALGVVGTGSDAGIDAVPVATHLAGPAFCVVQTAAAVAVGEGVALVTRRTRAHWTSSHRLLTPGPGSARVSGTTLT